MLTRLQAIQDIRCGRGIQLTFTNEDVPGKKTTYNLILRRMPIRWGSRMKCEAVIDCQLMRRSYYITLTAKQVLAYIRRHYSRHIEGVRVNSHPITMQEVA